ATAYRWKEANFISGVKRCAPAREFTVTSRHQRLAKFAKLGTTRSTMCKKILNARAVRKFDRLLRRTGQFLQAAGIEDFDEHRMPEPHFTLNQARRSSISARRFNTGRTLRRIARRRAPADLRVRLNV